VGQTAVGNGVERAVFAECLRKLFDSEFWRGEEGFYHPATVPFVEPSQRFELRLTGTMIALHFVTHGIAPPALSPAVFYLLCASTIIPEDQKVDATLMNLGLDFINGFDEHSAEFLAPLLALRVSDSVRAQAGTRLATVLAAMGFQVRHLINSINIT
jgi:hypothetical protein